MCKCCTSPDRYDTVLGDHAQSKVFISIDWEHGRIEVWNDDGLLIADCIARFCPVCGRCLDEMGGEGE